MKTETTTPSFFQLSVRVWALITATGAVAGVASILGFFGVYNWVLDLCSHFRVQYFFGLSLVAMLLLAPRRRRSAACFGALAVVNLVVILPLYFGRTPTLELGTPTVRAMLANVNTQTGNAAAVAAAIRLFNPDIVVLEEVSAQWLTDLKPVLDGYPYAEQDPREDNFGIGLWSRFPFVRSRIDFIGTAGVPSIIVEMDTPQGRCTVMATHPFPPIGREYSAFRNGQLAELPRSVRQASSPVVLLGDLNVTPWNHHFKRLLKQSGLKDSAQGRGVYPTWPTCNPLMLIPLDHCLYSHGIEIMNRQTGPQMGSDHFPVIVDFVIRKEEKTEANSAPLNMDAHGC